MEPSCWFHAGATIGTTNKCASSNILICPHAATGLTVKVVSCASGSTLLQVMGAVETFAFPSALEGLTDEEYFWEPGQPCWSVRRREDARTPNPLGEGDWILDYDVELAATRKARTSIAWNLAHVAPMPKMLTQMGFLGGAYEPTAVPLPPVPGSADAAISLLEHGWAELRSTLHQVDEADLHRSWSWAFGDTTGRQHTALLLNEVAHHLAYASALRDSFNAR